MFYITSVKFLFVKVNQRNAVETPLVDVITVNVLYQCHQQLNIFHIINFFPLCHLNLYKGRSVSALSAKF